MHFLRASDVPSFASIVATVATAIVVVTGGEVDGAPLPAILSAAWVANDDEDAITFFLATHLDVCGLTARRTQASADGIDALLDERDEAPSVTTTGPSASIGSVCRHEGSPTTTRTGSKGNLELEADMDLLGTDGGRPRAARYRAALPGALGRHGERQRLRPRRSPARTLTDPS